LKENQEGDSLLSNFENVVDLIRFLPKIDHGVQEYRLGQFLPNIEPNQPSSLAKNINKIKPNIVGF